MDCHAVFVTLWVTLIALVGCQSYEGVLGDGKSNAQVQVTTAKSFVPQAHDRIAVVVVDERRQYPDGMLRQAEGMFIQAVLGKGYTLAARSDVDEVLDELQFQASGATAQDYAKVGKMLNVSAILIVTVNASGVREKKSMLDSFLSEPTEQVYYSFATVEGRLISVRRAEILWIASHTGEVRIQNRRRGRIRAIPQVSSTVAEAFPSR